MSFWALLLVVLLSDVNVDVVIRHLTFRSLLLPPDEGIDHLSESLVELLKHPLPVSFSLLFGLKIHSPLSVSHTCSLMLRLIVLETIGWVVVDVLHWHSIEAVSTEHFLFGHLYGCHLNLAQVPTEELLGRVSGWDIVRGGRMAISLWAFREDTVATVIDIVSVRVYPLRWRISLLTFMALRLAFGC